MAKIEVKKQEVRGNGKGAKPTKAYSTGLIKHNKHDVAVENVHKKHNAGTLNAKKSSRVKAK